MGAAARPLAAHVYPFLSASAGPKGPALIVVRPLAAHVNHFHSMSEAPPRGASHDCPNEVDQKQLDELHIKIVEKAESK